MWGWRERLHLPCFSVTQRNCSYSIIHVVEPCRKQTFRDMDGIMKWRWRTLKMRWSLTLSGHMGSCLQCPWWLCVQLVLALKISVLLGGGASWQVVGHLVGQSLEENVGSLAPFCFSLCLLATASYYRHVPCVPPQAGCKGTKWP